MIRISLSLTHVHIDNNLARYSTIYHSSATFVLICEREKMQTTAAAKDKQCDSENVMLVAYSFIGPHPTLADGDSC